MRKPIVSLTVASLLLFAGMPQAARAQGTAPAPKPVIVQAPATSAVPTGDAVVAKYVEATGGVAAYDAIKNRVVHARLEILGAGVVLGVTVYAARPANVLTIIESEATGRIESGVSDNVVWENSAMRGPIVKEGAERDDSLRDAIFGRLEHWQDHLKSVECTGAVDVNGKPAYRVVAVPKSGSSQTFYFDKDSSLIVRTETTVNSAAGPVAVVADPGDFRKVDGILMPFASRMTVMGQQRQLTVDQVEHNVDLPADRFALPAEITAIVKK
jgi:hypothetical protein